jgi:hypothetical protein
MMNVRWAFDDVHFTNHLRRRIRHAPNLVQCRRVRNLRRIQFFRAGDRERQIRDFEPFLHYCRIQIPHRFIHIVFIDCLQNGFGCSQPR